MQTSRTEVLAAIDGDREAFARLTEQHTLLVRSVVLGEIRQRAETPDCVQEAFARAWRDIRRLRDPDRFTAWLAAIARNVAIDHRRASLRHRDHVSSDTEGIEELATNAPGPDDVAGDPEVARGLRSAIQALPRREATALALATDLGLAPSEIAQVLGTTSGNARVIVHRARRRLRDALVQEVVNRHGDSIDHGHHGTREVREPVAACAACRTFTYRVLRGHEQVAGWERASAMAPASGV